MNNSIPQSGPGATPRNNTPRNSRPYDAAIVEMFGQIDNGLAKGLLYIRGLYRWNVADAVADLREKHASAQAEAQALQIEIPKMISAIQQGTPYLPEDAAAFGLPATWLGRFGFVTFVVLLVLLEISAAVNISTLLLPVVQSTVAAWAMAAVFWAIPAQCKLFTPPFTPVRLGLGVAALTATAAYSLAVANALNVPGEESTGLAALLRYQLVAGTLGMAAVSMCILRMLNPPLSQALQNRLDKARARAFTLDGEIAKLDTQIQAYTDAENALAEEFCGLIALAREGYATAEEFARTKLASMKTYFSEHFSNRN